MRFKGEQADLHARRVYAIEAIKTVTAKNLGEPISTAQEWGFQELQLLRSCTMST